MEVQQTSQQKSSSLWTLYLLPPHSLRRRK